MDRKLRLKIFLRSLFLQSGWNFERFQNIGLCFTLLPHLKKIWPDSTRFKKAFLRHFGIFNTHPYMAGFIIGNICSMEKKISSAKSTEEEEKFIKSSVNIKSALASSFASIGDRIFWGRLTPIASMLCLIVWAIAGFYGWFLNYGEPEASIYILFAGPVSGAILITCVSLYVRWEGLKCGYECGGEKLCGLDMFSWPKIISRLSWIGLISTVSIFIFSLVLASIYYYKNFGIEGLIFKAILVIAAIGIFLIFRRLKKSIFLVLATVIVFSIVVVFISQIEGIALIL